jgi:NADH-quinone oxidoreductase subunit J
MGKAVGKELMTRYVVGFEVAGLLLTAALVGAIALAYREEDEPDAPARSDRDQSRVAPTPVAPQAAGPGLVSSGSRQADH